MSYVIIRIYDTSVTVRANKTEKRVIYLGRGMDMMTKKNDREVMISCIIKDGFSIRLKLLMLKVVSDSVSYFTTQWFLKLPGSWYIETKNDMLIYDNDLWSLDITLSFTIQRGSRQCCYQRIFFLNFHFHNTDS